MSLLLAQIDTDPDCARVASLLGGILIGWNQIEAQTRGLITAFLKDSPESRIMTAHMGTTTLFDTLNTLGNEFRDADYRDHLKHFRDFAERLRSYRNFYAHGIHVFLATDEGEAGGYAAQETAKGRLASAEALVTTTELRETLIQIDRLTAYGSALLFHSGSENWLKMHRYRHPGEPLPPLPDKPALPDRLLKTHLYPLDAWTLPQSSEA